MLPGDVLAGCAADGRHLRAAGVLHRNLLLRRLRRPPHQDQQVSRSAESVGAPVEWWVRQNLDNFLTNVQVLSSFCPMFVKVLSMSNICQKNFNFTKFCQIIVHI